MIKRHGEDFTGNEKKDMKTRFSPAPSLVNMQKISLGKTETKTNIPLFPDPFFSILKNRFIFWEREGVRRKAGKFTCQCPESMTETFQSPIVEKKEDNLTGKTLKKGN